MPDIREFAGRGRAPLAEMAEALSMTPGEVKRALAELSAAGLARLALGPEGDIPALRVGRLLRLDDEEGGCHVLFLRPPYKPLSASRKRRLARMVADAGDLSLGALTMLCGGMHVADHTGFMASAAIEDHVGVPRGDLGHGKGKPR